MTLLADTNKGTGRWVLMPRRGERFMGPQERNRARARRRRRHVFVVLLDAILLTLLMGLVPPFRIMWFVTAGLGVLLLGYTALLVQIRSTEAMARRPRRSPAYRSVAAMSRMAAARSSDWDVDDLVANGRGPGGTGNGHRGNGHGNGRGSRAEPQGVMSNGQASVLGRGHLAGDDGTAHRVRLRDNGDAIRNGHVDEGADAELFQLIDDDVHVIVRRAAPPADQGIAAAAR